MSAVSQPSNKNGIFKISNLNGISKDFKPKWNFLRFQTLKLVSSYLTSRALDLYYLQRSINLTSLRRPLGSLGNGYFRKKIKSINYIYEVKPLAK